MLKRPRGWAAFVAAPCLALVSACGGGVEIASEAPERPVPATPWRPLALPQTPPQTLRLVDSVPAPGATIAPGATELAIAHLAPAGLAFSPVDTCQPAGVTLRRTVTGLSDTAAQALVEHHLQCQLAPQSAHRIGIEGEGGAERFRAELPFATGADPGPPRLVKQDSRTLPRAAVNELFDSYVAAAIGQWLEALGETATDAVEDAIDDLAERAWGELVNPNATYDVFAQRVSYSSRNPRGEPDALLTGLIAMPEVGMGGFTPKSRMIVLSHATGSTPGSLANSDSWFLLAAILAGRGHLVIAPDNWGRGGQRSGPETYLMGGRVANNTVDLLRTVLASDDYRQFLPADGPPQLALIGYSQGGHSAMAVWLALQAVDVGVSVRELYSGGAPHNLYRTVIGALEALADRCDGNRWCRDVGEDTIRSYLVGRVLPGFLAHANVGLTEDEVTVDGAITPDFLRGMLETDSRFDAAKALLQLNSFTNLVDLAGALPSSDTRIHLYHSQFDRLVPERNTRELASLLEGGFNVTYHDEECGSTEYRLFARLVEDVVGAVHAVCGLEMLDEALKGLERLEAGAAGRRRP